MTPAEVSDFVENLRKLLAANPARFAPMVERQVQFALIPKITGTRAALEPALWTLLVLLLDGHEGAAPQATDSVWEHALEAARGGAGMAQPKARFPRAALAVAKVVQALRDVGVYPPPMLSRSA